MEKKHAMRDWEKDHDVMAAERALQPRYGNTSRNTPTSVPSATTSSHRAGGWRHSATLASSTSTTRSSARQTASDGCRAQLCMHCTHAKISVSNHECIARPQVLPPTAISRPQVLHSHGEHGCNMTSTARGWQHLCLIPWYLSMSSSMIPCTHERVSSAHRIYQRLQGRLCPQYLTLSRHYCALAKLFDAQHRAATIHVTYCGFAER